MRLDISEQELAEADRRYIEEFEISAADAAAAANCTVLLADERTLQLDIDSETDFQTFQRQLKTMLTMDGGYENNIPRYRKIEELRSRNGNRHILIHTQDRFDVPNRILWQALLGSDRMRELLNLYRHLKGVPDPIRLFRPREGS